MDTEAKKKERRKKKTVDGDSQAEQTGQELHRSLSNI